jgi:Rrf2 family protein
LKISTKGRYALRMLLDLAEHKENGFIPLKEIALRQEISKQYLEQIVSLLNSSQVLRANRGKQGGYMLAKEPFEYTVGEILRITEGSLAPIACLDNRNMDCNLSESCKTLPMWRGLDKVIKEYLDNITLQDMLDQYQRQGGDHYII